MLISISLSIEEIDRVSLEGVNSDLFSKISPKEYQGPEIIKDNFVFLGVPIEEYKYEIKQDKKFTHNYYFPLI